MNEEKDVPITLGEKYMLTIREASIYFNIGVKKIRRYVLNLRNISAEFLRYKFILFAVSS